MIIIPSSAMHYPLDSLRITDRNLAVCIDGHELLPIKFIKAQYIMSKLNIHNTAMRRIITLEENDRA